MRFKQKARERGRAELQQFTNIDFKARVHDIDY